MDEKNLKVSQLLKQRIVSRGRKFQDDAATRIGLEYIPEKPWFYQVYTFPKFRVIVTIAQDATCTLSVKRPNSKGRQGDVDKALRKFGFNPISFPPAVELPSGALYVFLRQATMH